METGDKFEDARAGREARDRDVSQPAGSRRSAIADGLKRYLSAQTYREGNPAKTRRTRAGTDPEDGRHDG